MQEKWTNLWKIVASVALALGALSSAMLGLELFGGGAEQVVQRAANVPIYFEQGGAKQVVGSGGELEVQSGATLDIQAGVAETHANDATFTGEVDFSGATLTGVSTSTLSSLTVNGNAVVTGTADLQGDVSDSAGTFTVADNADITGTVQYGADDLYPVGYATSGQQLVYGTSSITGTATAAHGLTTVTFCVATLGEDPETGAGDAAHVTVAVAANVCTLNAWQDDWTTAATETDVIVHWLAIGAP